MGIITITQHRHGTPPRAKTRRRLAAQWACLFMPFVDCKIITQAPGWFGHLMHPTKGHRGWLMPYQHIGGYLMPTRAQMRKTFPARPHEQHVEAMTNWQRSQWARGGYVFSLAGVFATIVKARPGLPLRPDDAQKGFVIIQHWEGREPYPEYKP